MGTPDAGSFKALDFRASWTSDAGVHALSPREPNLDVAPEARFEFDVQRLADVRIRLFDDSDQVVPSTDKLDSTDRTRYRLSPTELLQPGSRYFLVIDGQRDDQPTDGAGVAYDQARIELQTAGQKPVVEKKGSKKKKKR